MSQEIDSEKLSMRKSKSMGQAQQFLSAHAAVFNFFNLGRYWCQLRTIDMPGR